MSSPWRCWPSGSATSTAESVGQRVESQLATTTLFNRIVDTTLRAALHGTGARGYVGGSTPTCIQFTSKSAPAGPIAPVPTGVA